MSMELCRWELRVPSLAVGMQCNHSLTCCGGAAKKDPSEASRWMPKINWESLCIHYDSLPEAIRFLNFLTQSLSSFRNQNNSFCSLLAFLAFVVQLPLPPTRWVCGGVISPIATSCHSNSSKCVHWMLGEWGRRVIQPRLSANHCFSEAWRFNKGLGTCHINTS